MKKILIIIFLNSLIAFNGFAGTDGENALSKKNSGEVVKQTILNVSMLVLSASSDDYFNRNH